MMIDLEPDVEPRKLRCVIYEQSQLNGNTPVCPSCYHPLVIIESDQGEELYCSNPTCFDESTYPRKEENDE